MCWFVLEHLFIYTVWCTQFCFFIHFFLHFRAVIVIYKIKKYYSGKRKGIGGVFMCGHYIVCIDYNNNTCLFLRLTVVFPEILSTDITSPTTVNTVTRSGVSILYQTQAPCRPWATTTSLPITHCLQKNTMR